MPRTVIPTDLPPPSDKRVTSNRIGQDSFRTSLSAYTLVYEEHQRLVQDSSPNVTAEAQDSLCCVRLLGWMLLEATTDMMISDVTKSILHAFPPSGTTSTVSDPTRLRNAGRYYLDHWVRFCRLPITLTNYAQIIYIGFQ